MVECTCYGFKEDDSVKVTAQPCQDTEYDKNGPSECVECFQMAYTSHSYTPHCGALSDLVYTL